VGLEDCSFPANARDTKNGIPSEDRSSRRSPSISNSAWTRINVTTKREGDASQYDGFVSPEYAKRNSDQRQHLGNGRLSVKDQEKLVVVNGPLVVAETKEPSCCHKG
jgi:hypothetical protein